MTAQSPDGRRRLAVVTGAEQGIGKAIAWRLANDGWDLAFSYFSSDANAEATLRQLEGCGSAVYAARCDAGERFQVEAFFAAVGVWRGTPDLLVNNAGVQTWSPLLELAEEDWDRVIRTNLKGSFLNIQAAARRMVAAGKAGAIVNIGSGCNKLAFPRLVDYTASKGGIEQLTKSAAIELGPAGIRVNCVAPGAIETERTQLEAADYATRWARITPLGRIGRPEDVAAVVAFLASSDSAFVTGQTIWVDGGVFSQAAWPSPVSHYPDQR